MAEFFEVISVCSKPDAKTWAIAAPKIIKYISAQNYKLIVPDHEVELFRSISPASYQVLPETKFISNWQALLASHKPPLSGKKFGWYLQQFIKLAAVADAPEEAKVLIWDADTVPLKPLRFSNELGQLTFYTSDENHPPYFASIMKILGMEKRVAHSFIAQCLPTKSKWVREMFARIEHISGLPWQNAIIANLEMRLGTQFSEYETLGTFITHAHANEISFSENKWARNGNSLIKNLERVDASEMKAILADFDFVSFEKWDASTLKPFAKFKKKLRTAYKKTIRKILKIHPRT